MITLVWILLAVISIGIWTIVVKMATRSVTVFEFFVISVLSFMFAPISIVVAAGTGIGIILGVFLNSKWGQKRLW